MPANKGRDLKIKRGTDVIAGVRTKTLTANGEPIDVTTDDEEGYRTLLSDPGIQSLDMSIEGLTKNNDLRQAVLGSGSFMLTDINIEYPNGDTLSGSFFLTSLEESGAYNEAITFTGELQSSGEWTFTPVT